MENRLMPQKDTNSVLRYYAALQCASHEMLKAARAGDWDSVCRLEGACAVVIASLRQAAQDQPLKSNEQSERMRHLKAILDNDAEIRRICDPLPEFLDSRTFVIEGESQTLH
jgi:flagellar protein FliT